jgi:hypothetical protein
MHGSMSITLVHLKKYVSVPRSFLVINVCNQGKTLCSTCISHAVYAYGVFHNFYSLYILESIRLSLTLSALYEMPRFFKRLPLRTVTCDDTHGLL